MISLSWKKIRSKIKNRIKNLNRTDYLALVLFGVLLLVIAVPSSDKSASDALKESTLEAGEKDAAAEAEVSAETISNASADGDKASYMTWYKESLESELSGILSGMDGVGEATVMITLKDAGADVLDKNVKRDGESSETDTVVYSGTQGDAPYVTNRYAPDVEGVLVCAEGGGSAVVVSEISEAVMALFGIEAHKIKVVKKSE